MDGHSQAFLVWRKREDVTALVVCLLNNPPELGSDLDVRWRSKLVTAPVLVLPLLLALVGTVR